MNSNFSFIYSFFLIIGDFFAIVAAFVAAYIVRVKIDNRPTLIFVPARTYLAIFLTLLPFWLIMFALLGLYNRNIYEKRFSELGRLLVGSFVGFLSVLSYAYLSTQAIFPSRLVPFYGFAFAFLFLVIFRNLARAIRTMLFSYNIGISKLLIIGDSAITQELINAFWNPRTSGYNIVSVVGSEKSDNTHKVLYVPTFQTAIEQVGKDNIHGIIQTELFRDPAKNNEILDFAQRNHVSFRFIPGNAELFVGNIEVELFRQSVPVIAVHQTPLIGWGRIVKRLFDFFVALAGLIVLSPVLLFIAIAIKITGGGSVFFRQARLTRFNHEFKVYKFHTQYPKYDGTTPEEAFALMGKPGLAKTYRENGDFLESDPRNTPIGRFLRKTSLDELPQLFNVLRGDLSLVGPRALIPQELNTYAKKHAILSVKSGLTGLAVVSGRRNISFEERRKLDMYYVQNWTFWLDLVILMKTVRVIFTREGAQ